MGLQAIALDPVSHLDLYISFLFFSYFKRTKQNQRVEGERISVGGLRLFPWDRLGHGVTARYRMTGLVAVFRTSGAIRSLSTSVSRMSSRSRRDRKRVRS